MLHVQAWEPQLHALEALSLDCIHSHFAKCGMNWQGVDVDIVVSLSRVSALVCLLYVSDNVFQK
jgi:hypothetical protein